MKARQGGANQQLSYCTAGPLFVVISFDQLIPHRFHHCRRVGGSCVTKVVSEIMPADLTRVGPPSVTCRTYKGQARRPLRVHQPTAGPLLSTSVEPGRKSTPDLLSQDAQGHQKVRKAASTTATSFITPKFKPLVAPCLFVILLCVI